MTQRRNVDEVLEKYGYSSSRTPPSAANRLPSNILDNDVTVEKGRPTLDSPYLASNSSSVILPSPYSHIPVSAQKYQRSNSSQASSLQVRSYKSVREETMPPKMKDSDCNTIIIGDIYQGDIIDMELQCLKDELEEKRRALEVMSADVDVGLKGSKMEIDKYQSRCAMLEKDLEEHQRLLNQSEKEKNDLKKELDRHVDQITTCTREKDSDLQKHENLIQSLKESNHQMEEEISSLQKQLRSHVETSILREQELKEMAQLEHEKATMENMLKEAQKQIKYMKEEIEKTKDLELEMVRIDGACQVKLKETERLDEALDQCKALLETERCARYAADEQLSKLSIAKLEVDRGICAKNVELQAKCQRIEFLERQLADVEKDLESTIQQLESKRSSEQVHETRKAYERVVLEAQDSERRSEALERKIEEQEACILDQKRQIEIQKSVEENLKADIAKCSLYQKQCRDYESDLQKQEEVIDGLMKEKQTLIHQIKVIRETVASKDTDNKVLVEQLQEVSEYQSEVELLKKEIEMKKKEIEMKNKEIDNYQSSCSRIADELQEERGNINDLKQMVESLYQDKARLLHERDLMADSLDNVHMSHEANNENLRDIESRLSDAMLEISHRDEQVKEIPLMRNEIEQLLNLKRQQDVTTKEQQERIFDLENIISQLKQDHNDERKQGNTYKMLINENQIKVETQEQIIRDITAQFGRSQVLLEDRAKELEHSRTANEVKNERIKVLEDNMKEAQEEQTTLQCATEKCNSELILIKRENEDLHRRLEIADSKLDEIQKLYDVSVHRVEVLERNNVSLATSNGTVFNLEGQVDALRKLLLSRDEERAGFDRQMLEKAEIGEKLYASEQEIKIYKSRIEMLNSRISKGEDTILSLEKDLSKQLQDLADVSRDRIKTYKELETCRNDLKSCEIQKQQQVIRIIEVEELAKGKASIEGKLKGTEEVLAATKAELARTKDSLTTLNNRIRDQDNIILTIPRMERNVQELESMLTARQELVVSLQGELDKKLAKLNRMQEIIDQKSAEVIKMQSTVLDVETTLESTTVSLKRNQMELEELQMRFKKSEETHLLTERKLKAENLEIWKELMEVTTSRDDSNLNRNSDREELSKSKNMISKLNIELKMMQLAQEEKQAADQKTAERIRQYELQISQLNKELTESAKVAASFENCAIMCVKEKENEFKAKCDAAHVYENEIQFHRQELALTRRRLCEALELAEDRVHKLSVSGKLLCTLEADVSYLFSIVSASKKDQDSHAILREKNGACDSKLPLSSEVFNNKLEYQLRILSAKIQEIQDKLTESEDARNHLMQLVALGDYHALYVPLDQKQQTTVPNEGNSFSIVDAASQNRLTWTDIGKYTASEYSGTLLSVPSYTEENMRDIPAELLSVHQAHSIIPVSPAPKYPFDHRMMIVTSANALNTTPS